MIASRTSSAPMARPRRRSEPVARTSAEPDARIDHAVEEIDGEVARDDEKGAEEHGPHDHGDVEAQDGVERQASETGPVKDRLRQDDAVQERREIEADHGEERQARVA